MFTIKIKRYLVKKKSNNNNNNNNNKFIDFPNYQRPVLLTLIIKLYYTFTGVIKKFVDWCDEVNTNY